jgi:organic hydroperoxide reductase OsmC/OhrA
MEEHVYETHIRWDNDRKGVLTAKGIDDRITVATPPPFPKGMPGIWSPEHLFAASVSSCLMTTFLAIAEFSKLEFSAFDCKASSKLDKVDGKFQVTEVIMEPSVTILHERDIDKAERILRKSEKACLISNSFCGRVIMDKLDIRVAQVDAEAV